MELFPEMQLRNDLAPCLPVRAFFETQLEGNKGGEISSNAWEE